MKALEEKILKEGKVLPGDILKIDNFINHQIDVDFLDEIGKEIKRLFAEEEVSKVLTVEASGIAVAIAAAREFKGSKVVFGKKGEAKNMSDSVYTSKLYSFTRGREFNISVSKDYLNENDKVLIVDDFLANGEALNALIDIVKQSGASVTGAAIVVEKAYQSGGKRIRDMGIRVESLARVKSMDDEGNIEFC